MKQLNATPRLHFVHQRAQQDSTTCTCAEGGGWDQGWVILVLVEDTEKILLRHDSFDSGLKMTDASNVRSIVLQPTGVGATQATITLCQNSPSAGSQERVINISATGRASLTSTETGSCP